MSVCFDLSGTRHKLDISSLHPRNTSLLSIVASTEFLVKITLHSLLHSCGKANRLCVKPGRKYACRAAIGSCGKSNITFAIVVIVVPFGIVMFFGVCLFGLCCPTVLCLTNINDAAESNSAVFVSL